MHIVFTHYSISNTLEACEALRQRHASCPPFVCRTHILFLSVRIFFQASRNWMLWCFTGAWRCCLQKCLTFTGGKKLRAYSQLWLHILKWLETLIVYLQNFYLVITRAECLSFTWWSEKQNVTKRSTRSFWSFFHDTVSVQHWSMTYLGQISHYINKIIVEEHWRRNCCFALSTGGATISPN